MGFWNARVIVRDDAAAPPPITMIADALNSFVVATPPSVEFCERFLRSAAADHRGAARGAQRVLFSKTSRPPAVHHARLLRTRDPRCTRTT
jgi:hypothetical protein